MEIEGEPQVTGTLVKDLAVIKDREMQHSLELRGYGEIAKDDFILRPFESLYLLFCKRLVLTKQKKKINFDSLLQICKKEDEDILTKFLIYRDLRVRGYIVKDGFGFGTDFRVYEKGHFGAKGAKYLVFGLNEGRQEKMGKLRKKIGQITQMGKEPIIAVVERRGEIIYYKISNINFLENKHKNEKFNF